MKFKVSIFLEAMPETGEVVNGLTSASTEHIIEADTIENKRDMHLVVHELLNDVLEEPVAVAAIPEYEEPERPVAHGDLLD